MVYATKSDASRAVPGWGNQSQSNTGCPCGYSWIRLYNRLRLGNLDCSVYRRRQPKKITPRERSAQHVKVRFFSDLRGKRSGLVSDPEGPSLCHRGHRADLQARAVGRPGGADARMYGRSLNCSARSAADGCGPGHGHEDARWLLLKNRASLRPGEDIELESTAMRATPPAPGVPGIARQYAVRSRRWCASPAA